MNILILNWRGINHPFAGGAEFALFEHAKKWKSKGANVTWFTSAYKGVLPAEEIDGIKYIRVGNQMTVQLHAFFYFISGKFAKTDVVIDCFHFVPFFTPLYFLTAKKIALINEVAGRLWFSNLSLPFAAVGFLVEQASFIFYKNITFMTSSKSTEKDLIKKGVSSKQINTILNGATILNVRKSVKKNNFPTMLFLNRISIDKGIIDAFKAFDLIESEIGNLQFWIAGKEEVGGTIKTLAKKYLKKRAQRKVKYFGFVSQKEKFDLFKKSWILVHPSVKEGWGLTVIEAASQATPTVGYDVEGLRDSILHNKTGLLTKCDPVSLSSTIKKIILDNKMRFEFGESALRWAQKFRWKDSTDKSWKVISSNDKQK